MEHSLVQQAQAAPVEGDSPEEESNLNPEEQKTYDSAMQMVGELIYSNDEAFTAIMDLITPENPAVSVAEATTFVLSKVEETFQGNYPEELVITTADEISDLLLELADESGKFEVTEQIAQESKMELIDLLAQDYGADPADIEEALSDITDDDVTEMQKEMGIQNGQST